MIQMHDYQMNYTNHSGYKCAKKRVLLSDWEVGFHTRRGFELGQEKWVGLQLSEQKGHIPAKLG